MNIKGPASLFWAHLISSLRSFPSVFFTIFLPALLFVIFGFAFRVDASYAVFFLPGMIGTVFASDALHAVGPVIKKYYSLHIVRHFRLYPLPLAWLFLCFIATRLIFVLVASCILIFLSGFLFGYLPDFPTLMRYLAGVITGFSIYSLIALCVSFFGLADGKDEGILSVYYFLSIFLSDAFFVLSARGPFFDALGYAFPLKVVLQFMRGDMTALLYCSVWLVASLTMFILIINKLKLRRF